MRVETLLKIKGDHTKYLLLRSLKLFKIFYCVYMYVFML